MQRLVKEYLSEWKKQQRKRRRIGIAVMLLVVMVVGGVIGSLTQYGVALTGTPRCGIEEHTHDASCYTSAVNCGQEEDEGHQHTEACYTESTGLTCGMEEGEDHQHSDDCYTVSSELTCGQEESTGHTHTDTCYTEELTCGMEEHTHTDDCYIDTTADVEDASVWNEQYKDVEWKETWGENLVIAAQMQIGYKESSVNYIVSEDGSRKGYTRYGQFATNAEANAEDNPEGNTAGDVYRDWDAAFVNFCMYYAGLTSIEPKVFPEDLKAADTTTWCEEFGKIREENGDYLAAPEDHRPVPGDLVFSVRENEEREGQMGIVSSYNKEMNEIKVIEGNSQNEVRENTYDANDEKIVSYLMMSEIEKDYKEDKEDKEDEEKDIPEISEDIQEENAIIDESEEQEQDVITRYDYKDEYIRVLVTLTDPSDLPDNAELIVTPITLNEKAEKKIEEEIQNENTDVETMMAYDIRFVADGKEIQPGASVQVSIHIAEDSEGYNSSVFHVDENNEIENMGSDVDEEGNIIFNTPHFSTYVITLYGEGMYSEEEDDSNARSTEGSNSVIEYNKTAKVTNWDERTYDIEITASSKATENEKPDIFMVFDASGSMNYDINYTNGSKLIDPKLVGEDEESSKFCSVKDKLDKTKVYYYGNKVAVTTLSGTNNKYLDNPMVYFNGAWHYFESLSLEKGGRIENKDGKVVNNNGKVEINNGMYAPAYGNGDWKKITDTDEKLIYEWSSRVTTLKEVANEFINLSADICMKNQCRIGIVRFSSYSYLYSKLVDVTSNRDTLLKYINRLYGNGGTQPSLGLEQTISGNNKFDENNSTKKYVILFSDGKPEVGNSGNSDYEEKSEAERQKTNNTIKEMKNMGITVFTVGFGLDQDNLSWLNGLAEDKEHAFSANNAEELNQAFKKIQQDIIQNVEITKANVKDVIDPRFIILDDKGEPITPDTIGIEKGIKLEYNGGTVYKDANGNLYVEWKNQTIPEKSKPAWKNIIHVKAKEEYIGGNNVPTNVSPDSLIDAGDYGEFPLPQPTVNVKAELQVNNKKVTIFKGDSIPIEDKVLNTLFSDDAAKEFYNVIGEKYTQMRLDNFTLEWYKDENCTQKVTKDELGNIKPEDTTSYYLKVIYDAGQPTEESNKNTTLDDKIYESGVKGKVTAINSSQEDGYKDKPYGIYKINIISGEIRITKKLSETSDKEETFKFVIKKDGQDFRTIEIIIPANTAEYTLGGDTDSEGILKNLERGTYEITEKETEGYGIQKVEIGNDTDCRNERNENTIIFTIGENTMSMLGMNRNGNVINGDYEYTSGGRLGTVSFTNKKVIADDWSIIKQSSNSNGNIRKLLPGAEFRLTMNNDMDNAGEMIIMDHLADARDKFRSSISEGMINREIKFYGKSGTEGKVDWYEDEDWTMPIPKLPTGTYTLTETKAPKGYALSSENWTVNVIDGKLVDIQSSDQGVIDSEIRTQEDGSKITFFYYKNDTVYVLPDAGGRGIYWYMFSGILLMAGTALITYKKRCREVLGS